MSKVKLVIRKSVYDELMEKLMQRMKEKLCN